MAYFFKILTVCVASILFFGKIGMPSAMILFDYSFIKVFIVTVSAGIFGNIVFTNLSAVILKKWKIYQMKKIGYKKSKIFSKTSRRIIIIKKRFGLIGIAILTPIFFSIPLGAFIAEKFYKDKKKIIIHLSASVIGWNIIIYLIIRFFHDSFLKWSI